MPLCVAKRPIVRRVMQMPRGMAYQPEKFIETTVGRIRCPVLKFALSGTTLQPILSNQSRSVTSFLQNRAERVVVRQSLVELIVANVSMPLMQAR